MGIKEKDIKLLWGRAANRCSFSECRIKLSQDNKITSESFPLGEQAHIIGKDVGSARSNSILSPEERDSYHNLILLCPNHHTLIDKNPDEYPVEKLHMMKAQHELWVESTLSEVFDDKNKSFDVIYAHLIDSAVEGCNLEYFEKWVSVLNMPSHRVKIEVYENAIDFTHKIYKAVFPGKLVELESALKLFSSMINLMLSFYMENVTSTEDTFIEDKSYKERWRTPDVLKELAAKRDRWEKYLEELVVEVVKSANWFAEIVRRDVNPLFMATNGRFSLVVGPDDRLSLNTMVYEYSSDEKVQLVKSHEERYIHFRKKADAIGI
jgi:hypothetical protein